MAEKTEKATPKKLRDARKKGQVAKSQDFPSAFTFVVSIAATVIGAGMLYEQLGGYMVSIFRAVSGNVDMQNQAGGYLSVCLKTILNVSLPIMVLTAAIGMLISFLIVGPLFAMEAMKFDLKKLNPVDNLKNIFKFKTLFELLKSILKISGAVILIYTVIRNSLPEIIATAAMPVMGAALVFSKFLIDVVIRVGIFFLIVALFDLIYQKRRFANEMKMEKFEVKQEYKDTEGDPHIKGKRRQTAQEIAYQEGPSAVRRARAVITNPVHLAVAIEYDEEKEPAPKVVTMGRDIMADKIIQAAIEFNVPIMRNVPLAHTLYEKGQIGEYVPEETYKAIAEILRWIEGIEPSPEEVNVELFKK
jgi:type III secretion YscU/HrpY family protein